MSTFWTENAAAAEAARLNHIAPRRMLLGYREVIGVSSSLGLERSMPAGQRSRAEVIWLSRSFVLEAEMGFEEAGISLQPLTRPSIDAQAVQRAGDTDSNLQKSSTSVDLKFDAVLALLVNSRCYGLPVSTCSQTVRTEPIS